MSEPSVVSWSSAGGIATKNAPLMVQPGSMLLLDNVRQERANEWRTRAGTDHNTADDLPGGNVPVMLTEAPWGGLVGLCRPTDATTAARSYTPAAGTRWLTPPTNRIGATFYQSCCQTTPGVWHRSTVAPMTTGNIQPSLMSSAQGGGYRLTAWWTRVGTGFQVSLQSIDGATVQYFAQYSHDATAVRPRCVYSPVANMLVLVWATTGGSINVQRWDVATGAAVGTTVGLSATGHAADDCYLDAINYIGSATITIAYRNATGTGNLEIIEYNPSTNVGTTYTQAVDCSKTLALFPDPDGSGIRMVGVGTATPEARVIRLNSVGVIQTNQLVEAVDVLNMTGVAYNGGVDWMCVYNPNAGFTLRAVKRRSGATSAVAVLIGVGLMYCGLASAAWREPGTDTMRYMLLANGAAADDIQPTYLEMALEFENGSATIGNQWQEAQARLVPLNAGGPFGDRACLGQVQRLGADNYLVVLGRVTQFTDTSDGLGGSQFAMDAWTVQYLNFTTYNTQNVGEGTLTQSDAFLPAGSLLHTATGQLLCSHGASAVPFKPTSLTPSVGAGSLLNKTYIYGVTVTMPDESGNDWRSPMSITTSITLAGANNTVTVAGFLTPIENQLRRRVVMIWRTDGNGATFKLLHVIDDTVANTSSYNYVDTTDDVGSGQEYQFQLPGTSAGELEATLTPAFSHVTYWNGRLWGVDRDFPTRVRFSKPISTGLLPEFPDEFVCDLADQHGDLTGLAPMDDKIVAFKESAIYVAGGDGPGNDGSGNPYSFQLISSEGGAIIGSPLLSTGAEVYMVAPGGVFRVTRAQVVEFVGAAIDLYLSMPLLQSPETVTGMYLSVEKNEVRVQTSSYRFVHDRIFDVWERDTGGMGFGVLLTRRVGTKQALLLSNGQMWIEADDTTTTPSDGGIQYAGTLRGPWMRPANMTGWIHLYKVRALGQCTSSGNPVTPTLTVFFDDSDTGSETFDPVMSVTASADSYAAEVVTRKQLCTSFSAQLNLPYGDSSIRFDAWASLVSVLPGSKPVASRWKPPVAGSLSSSCIKALPTIAGTRGNWPLNGSLRDIGPHGLTLQSVDQFTEVPRAPTYVLFGTCLQAADLTWYDATHNSKLMLSDADSAYLRLTSFTVQFLMVQTRTFETPYITCSNPAGRSGGISPDRIGSLYSLYSSGGDCQVADQFIGSNLPVPFYGIVPGANNSTWAQVPGSPPPFAAPAAIAITRDGAGNYKAYRNGVLIGSIATAGAPVPAGNERFYVGGLESGVPPSGAFGGAGAIQIAGLRVLDYARSAADVLADANYMLGLT